MSVLFLPSKNVILRWSGDVEDMLHFSAWRWVTHAAHSCAKEKQNNLRYSSGLWPAEGAQQGGGVTIKVLQTSPLGKKSLCLTLSLDFTSASSWVSEITHRKRTWKNTDVIYLPPPEKWIYMTHISLFLIGESCRRFDCLFWLVTQKCP